METLLFFRIIKHGHFFIFTTFRDGRVLSDPFMKLPSRREYPDYYEIIKKPIDIKKILTKIDNGIVSFFITNLISNVGVQ